VEDAETKLGQLVTRVAGRGGKILIPAFAVGRTQELVYSLHALRRRQAIPDIPIYIDSPMAVNATDVFRLHPEVFDQTEWLVDEADRLFDFPMVHYVRDVEESKRLNSLTGPAVIISASGMCESGRILHHLKNHIGNHRNVVLFVGYQASHTLGRRLKEGQRVVKIFGRDIERNADVETLEGYSAHADRDELRQWVRQLDGPIHRAFVVHGETDAAEAMATILDQEGVAEVVVPKHGESFEL
jgi:metallo-beta-lactamase family protein